MRRIRIHVPLQDCALKMQGGGGAYVVFAGHYSNHWSGLWTGLWTGLLNGLFVHAYHTWDS